MSCRHCIYQSVVYEGDGEVPAVAEDDDFEKSFPSWCGHGWGRESEEDEGYQPVDVDNHWNRAKSTLPCPTIYFRVFALGSQRLSSLLDAVVLVFQYDFLNLFRFVILHLYKDCLYKYLFS